MADHNLAPHAVDENTFEVLLCVVRQPRENLLL